MVSRPHPRSSLLHGDITAYGYLLLLALPAWATHRVIRFASLIASALRPAAICPLQGLGLGRHYPFAYAQSRLYFWHSDFSRSLLFQFSNSPATTLFSHTG